MVKFWRVRDRKIAARLDLRSPINCLRLHRDSGLIGVGLSSGALLVVDDLQRRIVRRLCDPSERTGGWKGRGLLGVVAVAGGLGRRWGTAGVGSADG